MRTTPMYYTRRDVVAAMKSTGSNAEDLMEWAGDTIYNTMDGLMIDATFDGITRISPGDYIVREDGRIYHYTSEEFHNTFVVK